MTASDVHFLLGLLRDEEGLGARAVSLDEGRTLGQHRIATEHILLGLVREGDGVGFRILLNLDAGPEKIHQTLGLRAPSVRGPSPRRVPGWTWSGL